MWSDQTRDIVARIRFLTVCCVILWAFWGLVQIAEASGDARCLVWTAPDSAAVAVLAKVASDDDALDHPTQSE